MKNTWNYIIVIIIILVSLFIAKMEINGWEITFKRPLTGILFFITLITAIIEDGLFLK